MIEDKLVWDLPVRLFLNWNKFLAEKFGHSKKYLFLTTPLTAKCENKLNKRAVVQSENASIWFTSVLSSANAIVCSRKTTYFCFQGFLVKIRLYRLHWASKLLWPTHMSITIQFVFVNPRSENKTFAPWPMTHAFANLLHLMPYSFWFCSEWPRQKSARWSFTA